MKQTTWCQIANGRKTVYEIIIVMNNNDTTIYKAP